MLGRVDASIALLSLTQSLELVTGANMALPGFHDIETVGQKFAELINDGQNHQGKFIELYPIVKEN